MEMFIPRWHPSSVNKLMANHFKAKRLKDKDYGVIDSYRLHYKIPPANGKHRVSLAIIHHPAKSGRKGDPDNYLKSTLDALVRCGLLTDDSAHGVELGPITIERAEDWGTRITLEAV
jgi:Holliday junction resolvase RusA-like endonuclease